MSGKFWAYRGKAVGEEEKRTRAGCEALGMERDRKGCPANKGK